MAGALTTTVRIGGQSYRERKKIQGAQSPAVMGLQVADMITSQAVAKHERYFIHEQKALISAIRHAANIEARRLMDFVTRHMMGQNAGRYGLDWKASSFMDGMKTNANWKPAFPLGGQIEWKALGRRYMHVKGNDRFFVNTGQLRATLQSMRTSYPAALGGIQVSVKGLTQKSLYAVQRRAYGQDRRRVILGSIDIKIFPNARVSHFPGLATGQWGQVDWYAGLEASTFIPASIREKLSGPRRGNYPYRFRPMLGPATQFWVLHRIPAAMSMAVRNMKAPRMQRTNDSGFRTL